ncbi:MAG: 4Fe-4S ferredoxin, partial [Alphaproteobacteria bacterium]|nr:4Fe-4S ferredoxin [Alphaproteobacteria bacterium]
CPLGATAPQGKDGDGIAYDARVCAGCGLCAALCPTGAASYQLPAGGGIYERLRILLSTYFKAGGKNPVLLVHSAEKGGQVLDALAHHGDGLPAHVLPFAVNQATQVGLDVVLTALAYGAAAVRILIVPDRDKNVAPFADEIAVADTVMAGLGYGAGRAGLIETPDPDALAKALSAPAPGGVATPAAFKAAGRKRQIIQPALSHLHAQAPKPVETIPLPAGASFGRVIVDAQGCTLCLSCVGACPTGALKDNPEKPQLSFAESLCVQCGLCRATCPEKVIGLEPRLSFAAAARTHQVVKEEEPFHCIRCGRPFAAKSSIERIEEKLKSHPMFAGPAMQRLRMCENCRVVAIAEDETHPLAGPPRPSVRTTEDYLRERDDLRRQAAADMAARGLKPGNGKGSN